MSIDNAEQIAEWNGALGQRWVAMRQEIDRIVAPFGDAALKAAAPQPGERVIDIGCGCGETVDRNGADGRPTGSVLGIDVSQPMLEVARSHGVSAACPHLSFREGDASEAEASGKHRSAVLAFWRDVFQPTRQTPSAICASHCGKAAAACSSAGEHLATTRGRWRPFPRHAWRWTLRRRRATRRRPVRLHSPIKKGCALSCRMPASTISTCNASTQRSSLGRRRAPRPRAWCKSGPVSRLVREVGVEHLPIILDAIERDPLPSCRSEWPRQPERFDLDRCGDEPLVSRIEDTAGSVSV